MMLSSHAAIGCSSMSSSSRRPVAAVSQSFSTVGLAHPSRHVAHPGSSSPSLRQTWCAAKAQSVQPEAPAPKVPKFTQPVQELTPVPSTSEGKLISKTEVAAFIQRDDMMDQMLRWAFIEAGEGGVRNFGLPMDVKPFYHKLGPDNHSLWGFKVSMYKEGNQICDIGIMFDTQEVSKHEWVGRGDDGFPILEGKVDTIVGRNLEIWKLCARPVDEELRSSIRGFCTGLVTALNRYYAFGSVFVDDAQ